MYPDGSFSMFLVRAARGSDIAVSVTARLLIVMYFSLLVYFYMPVYLLYTSWIRFVYVRVQQSLEFAFGERGLSRTATQTCYHPKCRGHVASLKGLSWRGSRATSV